MSEELIDERVYTPQQLAAKVGQPRSILYALIAKQELTVIRRGSGPRARVWIRLSDWSAYLARHEQPAIGAKPLTPAPRSRPDIRDLPGSSRYIS